MKAIEKATTSTYTASPSSSLGSPTNGSEVDGTSRTNDSNGNHKNLPTPGYVSNVPVIPCTGRPLFPGLYSPIIVRDKVLIRTLLALKASSKPYVGVFLTKPKEQPSILTPPVTPDSKDDDLNVLPPSETTDPYTADTTPSGLPKKFKQNSDNEMLFEDDEIHLAKPKLETMGSIPVVLEKPSNTTTSPPQLSSLDTSASLASTVMPEDLYRVGTFSQIHRIITLADGSASVILVGLRRIEALEITSLKPHINVNVRHIDEYSKHNRSYHQDGTPKTPAEIEADEDLIKAYGTEIVTILKNIIWNSHIFAEQLSFLLKTLDWSNPSSFADNCASVTTSEPEKLQDILASFDVTERLHKTLLLLKKEEQVSRLQQDISRKVNESLQKHQRKFMLHEQLKSIKKELGIEKDDKDELRSKFTRRMKNKVIPNEVNQVFQDELSKLVTLEPSSMEFNSTRNYLDWISSLPWGVTTEETYDLKHAYQVLNRDHYGMEDIKDRILEFIAVGKMLQHAPTGKILLFVGPPGVGKTSIGKSIASALKREFFRFSVGGMSDVAEVKGHRRTYVGSMPGKLVQALKKCQCMNPVILIDEVDKIGRGGHHGDPASALLEVLDPEQNNSFADHYLDIPLDLSKVLFLCTANDLSMIPGPLRDRMDVIQLSGYVAQEKEAIAKQYLEPSVRTKTGIASSQAELTPSAIQSLIRWYCREAGVRNLQKHIEQIYRKIAFAIVNNAKTPVIVDAENLHEFVGQQVYSAERLYPRTPVGVVMGLAWSSMGGSVLYLESEISDSVYKRREKPDLQASYVDVHSIEIPTTTTSSSSSSTLSTTTTSLDTMKSKLNDPKTTNDVPESIDIPYHDERKDIDPTKKDKKDIDEDDPEKEKYRKDIDINKRHDDEDKDKKDKHDKQDQDIISSTSSSKKDKDEVHERGSLKLTGQLGDVMKESAQIAYTLAKAYLARLVLEETKAKESNKQYIQQQLSGTSSTNDIAKMIIPLPINNTSPIDPINIIEPSLGTSSTSTFKQFSLADNDDSLNVSPIFNVPSNDSELVNIPVTSSSADLPESYVPVMNPAFFAEHSIHVHVPQGSIPKDGPSAGIALVNCLLSQALNRPLVPDLSMTGEITLTGRVLPIGGVKEKTIASKRAGVKHIIVPRDNLKDFAELPAFVAEDLTVYFVETYDEVFRIAFGAPYAFNGRNAQPTLTKKYPKFDFDAHDKHLKSLKEDKISNNPTVSEQDTPNKDDDNDNNTNNNGTMNTNTNNNSPVTNTDTTNTSTSTSATSTSNFSATRSHKNMESVEKIDNILPSWFGQYVQDHTGFHVLPEAIYDSNIVHTLTTSHVQPSQHTMLPNKEHEIHQHWGFASTLFQPQTVKKLH